MKALFRNLALAVACVSAVMASLARAADYPTKPVHWYVGFVAGGPNDTVARVLGDWLSNYLHQRFVVEFAGVKIE